MRVLAISSAYGGATACTVQDGGMIAHAAVLEERGLTAALPEMVSSLLAGFTPELVGVVVGPGSFTGLRAGMAVAQGVALGCDVDAVGVTVAEAFAEEAEVSARCKLDGRVLWTAVHARRGRVFIDMPGAVAGCPLGALPEAPGRIAVCGNAANLVAAWLAAGGADVMLTSFRTPNAVHVASVALRRTLGALPPLAPLPLYVDAPEAKLPTGGLRPAPACNP